MSRRKTNPNRDRKELDSLDILSEHNFAKFLKAIKLEPFRHIDNLYLEFQHPISVISGTNRSGKSTVLMALACSHYKFIKRNAQNGNLERHTWSSLMQFTKNDKQLVDWTYFITYKFGNKIETKRGQRKHTTKKWNGIGKKESQFTDRSVIFIDLDRILPARNFSRVIFNRSKNAAESTISTNNKNVIEDYLSYILEQNFQLNKLASHQDKDIFKYSNTHQYSSYNAATGEEVLLKIILDCVEADSGSLILIDEIEIGLHPKIQRRLMDVLYNISVNDNKQFIITSHSQTILSSLSEKSRVFIERDYNNTFKAIQEISVNAALSKMDSNSYPLVDLYCEDDIAANIIGKAIDNLRINHNVSNANDLINVIISGSADKTYSYFTSHKETYPKKRIKTGYACILDGDMRSLKTSGGKVKYEPEPCLHFLYSSQPPEKFLVDAFLVNNYNDSLKYHSETSDKHCLFDKMIDLDICNDKSQAFELCWKEFIGSADGIIYINELENFLLSIMKEFSPDL